MTILVIAVKKKGVGMEFKRAGRKGIIRENFFEG